MSTVVSSTGVVLTVAAERAAVAGVVGVTGEGVELGTETVVLSLLGVGAVLASEFANGGDASEAAGAGDGAGAVTGVELANGAEVVDTSGAGAVGLKAVALVLLAVTSSLGAVAAVVVGELSSGSHSSDQCNNCEFHV